MSRCLEACARLPPVLPAQRQLRSLLSLFITNTASPSTVQVILQQEAPNLACLRRANVLTQPVGAYLACHQNRVASIPQAQVCHARRRLMKNAQPQPGQPALRRAKIEVRVVLRQAGVTPDAVTGARQAVAAIRARVVAEIQPVDREGPRPKLTYLRQ
jgi:hypothetical protein